MSWSGSGKSWEFDFSKIRGVAGVYLTTKAPRTLRFTKNILNSFPISQTKIVSTLWFGVEIATAFRPWYKISRVNEL